MRSSDMQTHACWARVGPHLC